MNLKSRKLIIAAIAAVGMVINDLCGRPVSDETIYAVLGILGTYILGQGIADAGAAKAAITAGVQVAKIVEKVVGDVKVIETEMHDASEAETK